MKQFAAHDVVRKPVARLRQVLDAGLDGVPANTVRKQMADVLQLLELLTKKSELSGPVYEDLVQLKSFYSRYQNYLNWLERS